MSKLPDLSQIDLAKIDSYERKNDHRTTVLSRVTALRRAEPWPGYDELTVAEIEAVLGQSDEHQPTSRHGRTRPAPVGRHSAISRPRSPRGAR